MYHLFSLNTLRIDLVRPVFLYIMPPLMSCENLQVPEVLEQFRFCNLSGLVLSFDGDGITIDSPDYMFGLFNRFLRFKGLDVSYACGDFSCWGEIGIWAELNGFGEWSGKLEDRWYNPASLLRAKPMPYSVWLVNSLVDAGAKVHVITSRIARLGEITKEWYGRHMPAIDFKRIHIRQEGDSRDGAVFKAETAREIGSFVHHEDSPVDIGEILETSSSIHVIALPLGVISLDESIDRKRVTEVRGSDLLEVAKLYCSDSFVDKIRGNNVAQS
jgi:hypothetical protein